MNWKSSNLQTRLYVIAAIILTTGLGSSGFIYSVNRSSSDSVSVDQLEYSKKYRHDLEIIGGKANVLAAELNDWFEGLWHGSSLAVTLAYHPCCILLYFSGCLPSSIGYGLSCEGPKHQIQINETGIVSNYRLD